jgi:hypothetical protein
MNLMVAAILAINSAGLLVWGVSPRARLVNPGIPWMAGGAFVFFGTILALDRLAAAPAAALLIAGLLLLGRGSRLNWRVTRSPTA